MSNVVRLDAHAHNRPAAPAAPATRPAPQRPPARVQVLRPATSAELDAEHVVRRLEEAGSTLLTIPGTGYSTKLRTSNLEVVRAAEAFGADTGGRIRPPIASPQEITRMDEALGWITLIPQDRYVLRRIVGARSLVSPATGRHLYSWRRLGTVLGADHKAVQRWHASGIAMIVEALGAR